MKILLFFILIQTALVADDTIRTGQLVIGTEPVRSNYVLMYDSLKSIVRKLVLGKGEGVLDPLTKNNLLAQEEYVKRIKLKCLDCVYETVRESHGNISHKIIFPDGFYIISSIDAGTLEWQTMPLTLEEFKGYESRLQEYIYDVTEEMGLNKTFDGMGGHLSQSGYGGDTFWMSNKLKLKAQNYDASWGFFGKDSYNANIPARFEDSQRIQYEMVLRDHDESWMKFLKELESEMDRSQLDTDKLIAIFNNRKTMTQYELLDRVSRVYYNKKQEFLPLGMRAKNKYVDTRADVRGIFENRAIRPQKSARELSLIGEYYVAQDWFIKEKLSEGYEFITKIPKYENKSKSTIVSNFIQQLEAYGLNWDEFKNFSKSKIIKSKDELITNTFNFSLYKVEYGAKKRDELFKKTFEHMLVNFDGSITHLKFISELMNEMSYTSKEAKRNFSLFHKYIGSNKYSKFGSEEKLIFASNTENMISKFSDLKGNIDYVSDYYEKAIRENFEKKDITKIIKAYSQSEKSHSFNLLYNDFEELISTKSNEAIIHNFTTLLNEQFERTGNGKNFSLGYDRLIRNISDLDLNKIPEDMFSLIKKFRQFPDTEETAGKFANILLDKVAAGKTKASPVAYEIFQYLDHEIPDPARVKKFKDMFLGMIKANKYGEENFYKFKEHVSNLFQLVDLSEHSQIISDLLPKIELAYSYAKAAGPHSGKSNEIDLMLFIKKLKSKQNSICLQYVN